MEVKHSSSVASLPLVVIEGKGSDLFGRNWLQQFRLDWNSIHQLQGDALQEVLTWYQSVFEPGLGTLKGYQDPRRGRSPASVLSCPPCTVRHEG